MIGSDVLASLLVLSMLAIMAAKTAAPLTAKITGEPALNVPLRPLFRLLDQRMNIIAIVGVLLLGSGFVGERWLPHGLFLFAVIAMMGMLCVPAQYRFTSDGVSPSRATFRPWGDFLAWGTSGNVVWLKGTGRLGSLRLYVSGKDRDKVLGVVKRHVPATSLAARL